MDEQLIHQKELAMEQTSGKQEDKTNPNTQSNRLKTISIFLGCCVAAFLVPFFLALLFGNSSEVAIKIGLAGMIVGSISSWHGCFKEHK